MNIEGKRALVTGAGGFIGSHLTERLVELGANVRAFVHYNASGTWGWLDQSPIRDDLEVIAGDIMDQDSVRQAAEGVDLVFHLAALIAIPYSYRAPASYIQTNVTGTLNVVRAALETGALVLHTSTSEVYGTAQYVPIDEAHPLQGQSPYSATKIGADKIAESFHLSFGMPVVTLRPFNTFGPRQSARAVIPTVITQCLAGETVRLGSLHPTRDFNFIENTVEGFVLAASTPEAIGQTINLGSGHEVSIGNMAEAVARLLNRSIRLEIDDQRIRPEDSEVERLVADNSLARRVLGWEPRVSFEDGLERTIEWLERHLEHYRPSTYAI